MSLKDIQSTGNKDTRSGFGDGIVEAARRNPNVVALCADLTGSLKMDAFEKEFPERFFQIGIAEALPPDLLLVEKFLIRPLLLIFLLEGFMIRSVSQ